MMDQTERKSSRFLLELDEYYKARKKHADAFQGVACPQNFIPGATKAKQNVKLVRNVSRKVSSVCYRGVVIQMKDSLTPVEKGLMPAGLLAVGVPAPSQHTSCLEHKLEQLWQRQSTMLESLPHLSEATSAENSDIGPYEDERYLEVARTKARGCSMPTTSRDIGTLPVVSDNDGVAAEFNRLKCHHKKRRMSYPLTFSEYEDYEPGQRKFNSFQQMQHIDSVSHLSALCRGVSYYGSTANNRGFSTERRTKKTFHTQNRPSKVLEEDPETTVNTNENVTTLQSKDTCWKNNPPFENDIKQNATKTEDKHEEKEQKISRAEMSKPKRGVGSSKFKNFKQRFTLRKSKSVDDEDDSSWLADKKTLSQIQNALRSKLPKTWQTTVRMGLSFDPVTIKERNNQGRDCNTLTSMLGGRVRSKSTPGSPTIVTRETRSQTLNLLPGPSLMVSPPIEDLNIDQETKYSLFDNLKKIGRNTFSKLSDKQQRVDQELIQLSLTEDELNRLTNSVHVKKLGNVLGPEFREIYAKERSRSLPLIRKRRKRPAIHPPVFSRSTSELGRDEIDQQPIFVGTWSSSSGTVESTQSDLTKYQRASFESEASEYDQLDSRDNDLTSSAERPEIETGKLNEKVSSPEVLVFLSMSQAKTASNLPSHYNAELLSDDKQDSCVYNSKALQSQPANKHLEINGSKNKHPSIPVQRCLVDSNTTDGSSHVNVESNDTTKTSTSDRKSDGIPPSKDLDMKPNKGKFSIRIEIKYVTKNGSKALKSSKELMEDSKACHGNQSPLIKKLVWKKPAEVEKVSNETDNELKVLDDLIKDLETYAID